MQLVMEMFVVRLLPFACWDLVCGDLSMAKK